MKLIVGLGNPGKEYERTRHNVGFKVVDRLAENWGIELRKKKFHARVGGGLASGDSVMLIKPQTYMNRSGLSVAEAAGFYQIAAEDLLVIVDEMALPLGQIRLRGKGSAGGHNGLKDIIAALGHQEFHRMRVGIGDAIHGDATGHVLGAFYPEEQDILNETLQRSEEAVHCWMESGLEEAMNRFNRRVEEKETE